MTKKKSERNKTLQLTNRDKMKYSKELFVLTEKNSTKNSLINKIINDDFFNVIDKLPASFVDLAFIDPPYNLTKSFNGKIFKQMTYEQYFDWVKSWLKPIKRILKPNATLYICGDWRTSSIIHKACLEEKLHVINRITFEREKGRGSNKFWKNNSEDIWFLTKSEKYTFNADAVKHKRRVIAPYKENGNPKDWAKETEGNYRLTYASNIWTDITIPFWSMPENTPHPTQKPEKLLAKIILASSNKDDIIFDPFAGVLTTAVVAKKLERNFLMIEREYEYCLLGLKRLGDASKNKSIQGYQNGYFLERNTNK